MSKKERVFNGWMFILTLLVVVWVKGTNAKAQEFPTLVPDGDYVTSTVTEYQDTDYSCSFKLIIENAGYYYFKEKTEDDTWWIVKSEINAHSWSYGKSVWYLQEGTYYIGPETYNRSGYPCVKVYSAECEFDLSDCKTTFDTSELVYKSNDIVKQWEDNASVVVSLSDGSKFTTKLEGVFLRPVLFENEKAIYGIGRETDTISKNPDFVNKKYILSGEYQIRLMNYTETYCEDSIDIKVVTCSLNSIPKIDFDKDIQVSQYSKMALEVTKPSYILIKNIDPIFVDSDGNVIEVNYTNYDELINEEEDLYNSYSYIYISKPQMIYWEYFGENNRDAAFYQMQMSVSLEKNLSQMHFFNELLSEQLDKTLSNYKVTLTSEGGKVINSSVNSIFETRTKIDGDVEWEDLSAGKHDVECILPNGNTICSFSININGSIKDDKSIEVYGNDGLINVKVGETKYIKIKPDHAGKFILIDSAALNLDDDTQQEYIGYGQSMIEDDEIIYGSITVGLNREYEMIANEELYIEVDNTEGNASQIVYAEILEQKITKLPEAIQNIDGSKNAGWLLDKLNKEIEFTMKTSMGDYKLDLNKWWGYSPKLVFANSIYAGYEVSTGSALFDGDKYYYVIENLLKHEITIKDTSKKEDKAEQQQSNTTDVGTTIKTTDVTYKITNNKAGKATVSYQAPVNTKKTNYSVPDTVKLSDGTVAKVTEIVPNAFKKCKKIKKVTIGKNVEKIGKNAFNGCKNLKTIKIKSTKLTKKSFGKNSFKGINKKATITVPKKVYKNYKKWLKNTGLPKSVKIKK